MSIDYRVRETASKAVEPRSGLREFVHSAASALRAALLGAATGAAAAFASVGFVIGLNGLRPFDAETTWLVLFLVAGYAAQGGLYGIFVGMACVVLWRLQCPGFRVGPRRQPLIVALAAVAIHVILVTGANAPGLLRETPYPAGTVALLAVALTVAAAIQTAAVSLFLRPRPRGIGRLAALPASLLAGWLGASLLLGDERPGAGGGISAAAGAPKVCLIGIEGEATDALEALLESGDLPALEALRRRGVHGRLAIADSAASPAIWTSVATGVAAERHGVRGHAIDVLPASLQDLALESPRHSGLREITSFLRRVGLTETVPPTSRNRRVHAAWNIASDAGLSVIVVNWPASWPAESLRGVVVSDRFAHGLSSSRKDGEGTPRWLASPPDFEAEIAPLVLRPDAVGSADLQRAAGLSLEETPAALESDGGLADLREELCRALAEDETHRLVTLEAMRRAADARLVLACFRGVHWVSHAARRAEAPVDRAPRAQRPRLGRVVERYWRYVDSVVGDIVEAAGEEATILVAAHHGHACLDDGSSVDGRSLPGVVFAAGPALKAGSQFDTASALDLAPTLLHLAGCPVAADLGGRVLEEWFRPGAIESRPVVRTESYGRRVAARPAAKRSGSEPCLIERLRAAGCDR